VYPLLHTQASFAYGSVRLPFRAPDAVPRDAPPEVQYLAAQRRAQRAKPWTTTYQQMRMSASQVETQLNELEPAHNQTQVQERMQSSESKNFSSYTTRSQSADCNSSAGSYGGYSASQPSYGTDSKSATDAINEIVQYPSMRDPFAPSRDNPLVPSEVSKLLAEREVRNAMPQRFRDAAQFQYPQRNIHPAYKTTNSVYGSQAPRNAELPSCYFAVTNAFSKTFLTGPYRNSSLCTSMHNKKPALK